MSDPSNDRSDKAVFRVRIRGTVDDVWRELTRTDRPQWAMFNSVLDTDGVAPGGQLRMRTPNGKFTAVVGEYIEVEKPARLSHTMRFTSYDDPPCTVTYDIEEEAEGVTLTLTVIKIPLGTKSAKQLRSGGSFIVNNIKAIIETGRPTLGARMMFAVFGLLAPFTPKRLHSDNWPIESTGD